MNIFKSHFWYNKHQRNGILFLVVLILILQGFIVFGNFFSAENLDTNSSELVAFQNQIDSLKTIKIKNRKPKIYPFNPNYITDYKGEQLGMSLDEIDRLHSFRKQNKFVNSVKEFQNITKISDSLLAKISPSFKFPDWVVARNKRLKEKQNLSFSINQKPIEYTKISTKEGKKEEIVKLNINTATFKEVLKIPGIDYELCKKIFDFRDEVAELQNISELKNIEDFPLEKYDGIVVYLKAE